jgi:hypothetical protein
LQITRYSNLNEDQFLGCISAFVDSLFGQLNSAAIYLRKLEGEPKGAAFAFEMALDNHRYGALLVLDRWAELVHAFGPHINLANRQSIIDEAPARVQTAENILGRANQILDATPRYSTAIVEACVIAFQSLQTTFRDEQASAGQSAKLGPMLPEDFKKARGIFLEDLAAR